MLIYEPETAGGTFEFHAEKCKQWLKDRGYSDCKFKFNDVIVNVYPESYARDLWEKWYMQRNLDNSIRKF